MLRDVVRDAPGDDGAHAREAAGTHHDELRFELAGGVDDGRPERAATGTGVAGGDEPGHLRHLDAAPRDAAKTIADVTSMRALMLRERPPRHAFDLKLADGGLVDLEFIAQSAQLLIGKSLGVPQAPTAVVLERLGANGVLAEGARLAEIHGVYSAVLQVVSAALLHPFRDEEWTAPFKELLARLTHYPSFSRLADDLAAMRDEVGAAAVKWYAGEGRGP